MQLRAIVSAGGVVAVGMVIGRVLGLLRELAIAAYFGTSGQADAAIFLLLVPDFITSVFIASAGSAALVPAFAARSPERATTLLWQTMRISVLGFLAIALVIIGLDAPIARLFSIDMRDAAHTQQAIVLTAFSLPFMAATWVFTAWLQYRERFGAPAFANAVFNTVILLTLWIAQANLLALAIGSLVATLLRLAVHVIAFLRAGGSMRGAKQSHAQPWEFDRNIAAIYLQASLTAVVLMLPVYAPYFIMTAQSGGIALFNYAFKLVLLPTMLLQTAMQTVLLPLLAKQCHAGDVSRIAQTRNLSVAVAAIVGLAIALAVMVGAQPIAALCFGRGGISPEDVAEIAALLRIGACATPLVLVACLWQQLLYASQHAKAAMLASVAGTVLLLPLYWFGFTLGGTHTVMAGYVALSGLYLLQIMRMGKKYLPSLRLVPGRDGMCAAVAMLVVFALLAVGYQQVLTAGYAPVINVLVAVAIGGMTLSVGLVSHARIRALLLAQIGNKGEERL